MIEIALAAALLSAEPFLRQDWRYGGGSPNVVMGYDHASIRATGSIRTLSTVYVAAQTETLSGITSDYTVYQTSIDCEARTRQNYRTDVYLFSSDTPVLSYVSRQGATTPGRGSPGMGLIEAVCGDRPQPEMPGGRIGRSVRHFALWFRVSLAAGNIR
jgi:hypothetical protein